MTRPPASPGHHLLTRSDLAALGIDADRVLTWLATGRIEQVGSLPGPEPHGEPVFAVLAHELRRELATRLLELGKDTVVLSPLRVRSLLMRTRLLQDRPPAAPPRQPPAGDPIAEALLDPALSQALHLTAQKLAYGVEQVLALAREEARLEALEQATRAAATAHGDAAAPEATPVRVDFFDAEDLVEELGLWEPIETAAAEPAIRDKETMSEVTRHEETLGSVERTAEEALDALFGPTEPATAESAPEDAAFEVDLPPLEPPPSAIDELAEAAPAVDEAIAEPGEPASALAMQRVESFLGELRTVLVEMAQRPAPIDVQPLVAAVQQGFADARDQARTTEAGLASMTERLGRFGDKVEHGVALAVHAALGAHSHGPTAAAEPVAPTFVVARTERSTVALCALGFLLLCWSGVLWLKTGNSQLALATLVGGNLIGCCLLVGRRRS